MSRLPSVLTVLAVLLLVSAAASGQEQIITRIGIFDLDEVVHNHFRQSQALRSYQSRWQEVLAERDAIEEKIYTLEQTLIDARHVEDYGRALRLDAELFDLREYLLEYVRIKNEQLSRELDGLKTSDAFIRELTLAIEFVAEAGGYSLITRRTRDLLFWRPEIDVTDEVIAELSRRAARR